MQKSGMETSAVAIATVLAAAVFAPAAVALDMDAMTAHAAAIPANLEIKDGATDDDLVASISELKGLQEKQMQTFDAFKKKNDERLADIESRGGADPVTEDSLKKMNDELATLGEQIQDIIAKGNRPGGAPNVEGDPEAADEHKRQFFEGFITKGHQIDPEVEKKALNTTTGGDGGYAVPEVIDSEIEKRVVEMSAVRDLVTVKSIETSDYKRLVNVGGATSGWVGETDARPQTSTPSLEQLAFVPGEIYANAAATQRALDDMQFDAEAWLMEEVAEEFAVQEGAAVVTGNGTNKPKGFLAYTTSTAADGARTYGEVQYIPTGVAGDWAATNKSDILIDVIHAMKPGYRGGAKWTMNGLTLAEVRKLKDADGNYLWRPGISEGISGLLLGYGIAELPDMPDMAADSLSIAFGNFKRAYIMVVRKGFRVLRDPFTNKPYVHFYATSRVGGGMKEDEALKLIKFGAA